MDRAIDRLAKWIAETGIDRGDQLPSRRRLLHRGAAFAIGAAGALTLAGRRASPAEAQVKDGYTGHIGEGPEEPIYWPPQEGEAAVSLLGYEECPPGFGYVCGACQSRAYYCAGRYHVGGGNYQCYDYIYNYRHCGKRDGSNCNYNDYCSYSTYWSSIRCYGPPGCV